MSPPGVSDLVAVVLDVANLLDHARAEGVLSLRELDTRIEMGLALVTADDLAFGFKGGPYNRDTDS
jgi:hypothetical protein